MSLPFDARMIVTLLFVTLCCAVDLRAGRIPNVLSGTAVIVGLWLGVLKGGVSGLIASAVGALFVGAILLLPFSLGGIGAGDVKMMAALGALLGTRVALVGLLVGMAFGGVIAVVYLLYRGRLSEKLTATRRRALAAVITRSLAPLKMSAGDADAIALPYSLPLAVGTLVSIAALGVP